MFSSSKWVKDALIVLLVILWLTLRVGHKDNQDDWSPLDNLQVASPITLEKIICMWVMLLLRFDNPY
jgi:hypothetical protein